MTFADNVMRWVDAYLQTRDWCKCCQAVHSKGVDCECLS
jgi:hypothetical protein